MKVLFIDLQAKASDVLASIFEQAGITCRWAKEDNDLYALMEHWSADLIFVHTSSPHRDVLEHMAHSRQDSPQTVIRLFAEHSQSIARLAEVLNISLYAHRGLRDSLLQSLVDITITELHSRQQLHTEIAASRFTRQQHGEANRPIRHISQADDLAPQQAKAALGQNTASAQ